METRKKEPEVTAGRTIFELNKGEVRDAVFFFAVGRKPTDSEMKRLVFYVRDDDRGVLENLGH